VRRLSNRLQKLERVPGQNLLPTATLLVQFDLTVDEHRAMNVWTRLGSAMQLETRFLWLRMPVTPDRASAIGKSAGLAAGLGIASDSS
jgi:hypothetical protein